MDEDEAIAIVGLGCRYPGADNLQEFWKLLCTGEDHVNEIPKERWNNAAFFDEDPDARGKTYVTKCGFIEDINGFDNTLWGISNTEAQKMDPQQRLVLECTHMAFEDGGFTRKYLDGSKTGVYMGTMTDDYRNMYADAYEDMSVYSLTGMSGSIISNRVSYTYNLHGPSITLDTACSSGLVAIDVASLALRRGDINLAVCGGVNVLQLPYINMALCRARMLSRTGKCHTFSADADGYARGEGCGVVILKKLKQARCDNDKIWGTIATQCNQDGRMATPITAPSGEQQKQLLELIYPASNIDAALIQYIEAHETIGMVVDSLIEHFDQVDNSKTGDAMQPGIAEGRTRDSPLLTVATAGGETNGFQKGTILRYIGNESNGDQERTAYSLLTPFLAPIPTKRKLQKNRPNLKESFLKMLPNGMLHTVSVILEGGNNKHAHRNMLRWFSRKFSWNKELPVRHIVDVNTVRQFGWFALIVTARQQQYVFYKRELHPVQKWAEAIQERLLEK